MNPLFGTALARSGGGLLSHFVSAHDDVVLARHPFLEVFRSLRNAVVRSMDDPGAAAGVPPAAPLQDYYFVPERLRVLDAVLDADLALPVAPEERPELLARGAERCALESPDLAPHFGRLDGETYLELFANGLAMIRDVRGAHDKPWVGFQEPWILEFFPALARAHPAARFLVLVRDPRAVVGSMKGIARTDPEQVVDALSYARHWRKYVALLIRFSQDPLLRDRLLVLRYEDLVGDADATMRRLCDALGLEPDRRMLDAASYVEAGTGETWTGNSSFGTRGGAIDPDAAERWRTTLEPSLQHLVAWTCEAEMRLMGYEPAVPDADIAIGALVEESRGYSHWRTDLGDPLADAGAELLRRALLEHRDEPDQDLVRRCFLLPGVREQLLVGGHWTCLT